MKFTVFSTFCLLLIPMTSAQVTLIGQIVSGSELVTIESVSSSLTPNGGKSCQVVINGPEITGGTTVICSDGAIAVNTASSAPTMTQTTTLLGTSVDVSSTSVMAGTSAVYSIKTLSDTSAASRTSSGTNSITVLPPSSNANPVVTSTITGGFAGPTSGPRIDFVIVAGFLGVVAVL